jgi:hypothetical protein
MKPIDENPSPGSVDDRRLDRLVDGELDERDRRALLVQLEQEPEGWRRCALAFLESQCWRKELGAVVPPAACQPAAPRPPRRNTWLRRLATPLAMAASFLAALLLGMQVRQTWHGGPSGPGPATDQLAARDRAKIDIPRQGPPAGPEEPFTSPWQMVALSAPDGPDGDRQTIRLPAVVRDQLDERWMESFPAAVPADVLRSLERTGHQVQQRRGLLPVQMKDGRQLVVPVDQVEVRFVGRPAL